MVVFLYCFQFYSLLIYVDDNLFDLCSMYDLIIYVKIVCKSVLFVGSKRCCIPTLSTNFLLIL